MKNTPIYSLIFAIFLPFYGYSQPAIEWQETYGGSANENFAFMIMTDDLGYLLCGTTFSSDGDITLNHGGSDVWVVKLNNAREIEWQKTYGGNVTDNDVSAVQLEDGYLLTATSESTTGDVSGNHGGGGDVWLFKIDLDGNLIWQKCLGGNSNDFSKDIRPTTDGNFIFVAYSASTNGNIEEYYGSEDLWIMKINADGDSIWEANIGDIGSDQVYGMSITSDGGCILVGQTFSTTGIFSENHGFGDLIAVKIDATGNMEWAHAYGGTYGEVAFSVLETTGGNFMVVGQTASTDGQVTDNHGGNDIWLLKLNATGDLIWEKCIGGTGSDNMSYKSKGIIESSPGNYIFTGYTDSEDGDFSINKGLYDALLVKFNEEGTILWERTYGGSLTETFGSITAAPDGGYYLTGATYSDDGDIDAENRGGSDAWFLKVEADVVEISDADTQPSFSLINTISAEGIFGINNPENQPLAIQIFNLHGEVVYTTNSSSSLEIILNATTGVYFLQILSGPYNSIYKIVSF